MNIRIVLAAVALGAMSFSQPAAAFSRHTWSVASRVGEVGLGVVALGGPVAGDDWPGFWQAGGSIAAASAVTHGLKAVVHEERPDHSGDDSFPSGHTTVAFASAATMHERYGWEVGLPATLVATFVGVARVEAHKHHWYDVVAGAAIGEASGLLIAHPFDDNVRLVPWSDGSGGVLAFAARF